MGNGSLGPSGSEHTLKSVFVDGGSFRRSLGFGSELCNADQVDLNGFSPFAAGQPSGGAFLDPSLSRQRLEMSGSEWS